MTWRVMKFGGSSVGRPDRLAQVVRTARDASSDGPLIVVCSAFSDSTDHLLEAVRHALAGDRSGVTQALGRVREETARALSGATLALGVTVPWETIAAPLIEQVESTLARGAAAFASEAAFRDEVVSFGERISCSTIAALLRAVDAPADFVDARELLLTDDGFGSARVLQDESRDQVMAALERWRGRLPVVTGFLGRTRDGRTTTLGRNGSDYTAALLAAFAGARELTVWTDVTGVLTADPTLVPDAYPVRHLSYAEASDLAHLGLRMFHPRTMGPLAEAGVPLTIRHTMKPDDPGTRVDLVGAYSPDKPTCVISDEGLSLLELEAGGLGSSLGGRALAALRASRIPARVGVHELGGGLSVVVSGEDGERAQALLASAFGVEGAVVQLRRPVTLVTLLAESMGRGANVAGRLFAAVGGLGINVRAIAMAANSRSISFVVDDHEATLAVRAAHDAFNLAHTELSLMVLGKGTVGGALLDQVRDQREVLQREHGLKLKVVGIADGRRLWIEPAGIDLDTWRESLARVPESAIQPPDIRSVLPTVGRLPMPVLVDATAQDGHEALYQQAFESGLHVVAANKKPLTTPQEVRDQLLSSARRNHRRYQYETTVGASLPVVGTLKDLVRTGDRVRLVEGAFSGTLGFLCDALMSGVPLSQAVREAKAGGYTEPHPRDDLLGLDVARKALILAREIGCRLDLEDVTVQPFVPAHLLQEPDVDKFLASLSSQDAETAGQIERYRQEGRVLRYLARIDPAATDRRAMLTVGPVAVEASHPAARLAGTEAFVAFTTARHHARPLVVQGAGAGGEVTAAGVLADILSIGHSARAGG